MGWSEQMVLDFQKQNNKMLAEINATLRPSKGKKTGKIGIMCPGQAGDHATTMSVLKYVDILPQFKDKEIIYFTNFPNADNLRYSNIHEVRKYPWAGNGLSAGTPDFYPLLCTNNRLNKELASQYDLTKDLEEAYFPTPWMVAAEKQHGIDYPNVSKMIFNVPIEWEWHPLLAWSDEEREVIRSMMEGLPKGRKNILLETFCGSGQSNFWDEDTTRKIMKICREKLGAVNFIFGSHLHKGGIDNIGIPNSIFFDDDGCIGCEKLTVRQTALVIEYCSLMVCMSSGISCATSACGVKSVTKLQFCGSKKCSTAEIANGAFHLVTTDSRTKENATAEFFNKLNEVLNDIK